MAGFVFRLEKVHEYRKRIVDQKSLALAEAQKRIDHLNERIGGMEQAIADQERAMMDEDVGQLHPGTLISGTAWLEHLHQVRDEFSRELAVATDDWAAGRARLTEAWREYEVLSRLRERQEETWRGARTNRERREMDEIGQVRAFRHGETIVSH